MTSNPWTFSSWTRHLRIKIWNKRLLWMLKVAFLLRLLTVAHCTIIQHCPFYWNYSSHILASLLPMQLWGYVCWQLSLLLMVVMPIQVIFWPSAISFNGLQFFNTTSHIFFLDVMKWPEETTLAGYILTSCS